MTPMSHRIDLATFVLAPEITTPVLSTAYYLNGRLTLMQHAVSPAEVGKNHGSEQFSQSQQMVAQIVTPTEHKLDPATHKSALLTVFCLPGSVTPMESAVKIVEVECRLGSGRLKSKTPMVVHHVTLTEHRKDPATLRSVLLTVFCLTGSPVESAVKNVEVECRLG